MSRDKIYIGQIIEAIEKIEDYTKEGQEAFKNAEIIQDAVIRNIEVVGEVAKKYLMCLNSKIVTFPGERWLGSVMF